MRHRASPYLEPRCDYPIAATTVGICGSLACPLYTHARRSDTPDCLIDIIWMQDLQRSSNEPVIIFTRQGFLVPWLRSIKYYLCTRDKTNRSRQETSCLRACLSFRCDLLFAAVEHGSSINYDTVGCTE